MVLCLKAWESRSLPGLLSALLYTSNLFTDFQKRLLKRGRFFIVSAPNLPISVIKQHKTAIFVYINKKNMVVSRFAMELINE
jgi:hypothetical protein